jgi:hypothetical protein
MDPSTNPKDTLRVPVPLPTGVGGLQDLCKWMNYIDGVLTAHALTQGSADELNIFMRKIWEWSPLAYAALKWWLFWVGLNLLEKSILEGAIPDPTHTRRNLLRFVLGVFTTVLVWHVVILRISR